MADNINNSNDSGFLYFMVGVLVIGLIGLGYFYYNGTPSVSSNNTTIIEKTTTDRVHDTTPAAPAPETSPNKY
ncbi:MAG: hypothetical protein ACAH83_09255 [Alphaproteobacteria bacterium]